MKYTKLNLLALFLFIIVLMPTANATVGIGIKWFTVAEYVNENSQYCIDYGLYNPFDEEVMGYLTAAKGLEDIYEAEEDKLIPTETSSKKAIMTKICFNIPKTYRDDCLFGKFILCKRACNEEQVVYNGEVMAAYKLKGNTGGTGSATGTSFAAPLKLMVKCEPKDRNYTPVYILLFLIIAIYIIMWKKKKKNNKNIWRRN